MKKSSLLALSLVSLVSLVGCGKPTAADPKKAMEAYVKEVFGAEYVDSIEYDEDHYLYNVPYYVVGFLYDLDEAEGYLDLCNQAYADSKPVLEKMGFALDFEVEDAPEYEQAAFGFYAIDNEEDPTKATYYNEFMGFTGYYEDEDTGDTYMFFQAELIDFSSYLK